MVDFCRPGHILLLITVYVCVCVCVCVPRKLEHVQTSTENFHGSLGGRLTPKQATSNFKDIFLSRLLGSNEL